MNTSEKMSVDSIQVQTSTASTQIECSYTMKIRKSDIALPVESLHSLRSRNIREVPEQDQMLLVAINLYLAFGFNMCVLPDMYCIKLLSNAVENEKLMHCNNVNRKNRDRLDPR